VGAGVRARCVQAGPSAASRADARPGLALLREAHALLPTHADAADTLGCALAEYGPAEEAVAVLRAAAALAPQAGHEKFMYLGHLLSGAESLEHLRTGVALLEAEARRGAPDASASARPDPLRSASAGGERAEAHAALCAGLCSLAEGLLGEAAESGDVSAAAGEARALLTRAARLDPTSPEPLQALAGLAAEQGQPDEALALLRRSLACWQAEDPSDDAQLPSPSFEFRLETAKLLLDCDESTAAAVRLLEGLLEEDDSRPEVWHLLALAHHGGCAFGRARNCLAQARALLGSLEAAPREWLEGELGELEAAVEASAAAWLADGGAAEEEEEEEE